MLVLCQPLAAAAHAPPQVFEAIVAPTGDAAVLLTNRGLLFGSLPSGPWRLMCNEAVGINGFEQPDLALLPDGSLIAATTAGLQRTADGGCSWQGVEPFAGVSTPALVQEPSAAATLYVAVFAPDIGGIHVSADAGASWSLRYGVGDHDYIEELLLVPSAPEQLYASGQVFDDMGNFTHYVARSRDRGATFERHEVALLDNEADVTLLAVSPSDPDLLLARALDNSGTLAMRMDRLLVSRDGGQTFASVLTVNMLLDAQFAADGTTAWAASIEGLWRSDDVAATFEQVPGPERASCAIERQDELWVCGWYAPGRDGVGVSTDGGRSFTPLLSFDQVTEPVACPAASATAMTCDMLWRDWQREILFGVDAGTSAAPDAGAADASTADASSRPDAATTARDRSHSGCSVREGDLDSPARCAALAAVSIAILVRLRRSRRRAAARGA